MVYIPTTSPPMSDSDSNCGPVRRVLRPIGNSQQRTAKAAAQVEKSTASCDCGVQLTELRKEVSELTKTINEMNSIVYARLLFPHLSLNDALADGVEVSYSHVKAPKRSRADSALYVPDIPDGFSDSTAHSLAFGRRTKATTTEQECHRALKRLQVTANKPPGAETIVVQESKKVSVTRLGRKRDAAEIMRTTRSGRVRK